MKLIALHDTHNAAVGYMEDGVVKYAIQEERITRMKNAGGRPINSLTDTLEHNKIALADIDRFVFVGTDSVPFEDPDTRAYYKTKYKNYFEQRPVGVFKKIVRGMPGIRGWREHRIRNVRLKIQNERVDWLLERGVPTEKILRIDHHLCHASAAAYGWGKKDRFAVITLDSAGDNIAGTISVFENGVLDRKAEVEVADSIARLYSMVTFYLGMMPMEHEYKVMGLSSYAEGSKEARGIADFLHGLFEVSSLDLAYRRRPGIEPVYDMGTRLKSRFEYHRFDHIAAGVQIFIEEFVASWVGSVLKKLSVDSVALSGGIFMNVKLNKKIGELPGVREMFIFPSCGDETNVFGALYNTHKRLTGEDPEPLKHFYWGADTTEDFAVERALSKWSFSEGVEWKRFDNIDKEVARLITEGRVIARCSGPMEFGARALGNRSILALPSRFDLIREINHAIKNRDFWMPFGASVTDGGRYFINPKNFEAPYMILLFDTIEEHVGAIVAGTHQHDKSCRPQIVSTNQNPSYAYIINEVGRLTGEPAVLNTSFNLHGYPIVYTPEDALDVFNRSGLTHLAVGNYLVVKKKHV